MSILFNLFKAVSISLWGVFLHFIIPFNRRQPYSVDKIEKKVYNAPITELERD